MSGVAVPCAVAGPRPCHTPVAGPQRQLTAVPCRRQRPGRSSLQASVQRRPVAAASDDGDDFEEMLGRREELMRQRDDVEDGLNTEEDEELAAITDRGSKLRCFAPRHSGRPPGFQLLEPTL